MATLPAARPQPKSGLKLTPREQAAERRRQLAELCAGSEVATWSNRGAVNVPRDHTVVQTSDGRVVARSNALWLPTPVEEEVLDYSSRLCERFGLVTILFCLTEIRQ